MSVQLYRHPHVYDLQHGSVFEDVAFYLWVVSEVEGPILELGAGSGRLTLPLARLGRQVHGVDHSAEMLAVLQRALLVDDDLRDRVQLQCADVVEAAPSDTPALVLVPTRLVNHLDEDAVRGLVARLSEIAEGATLAMDAYLWSEELSDYEDSVERTHVVDPRTGEVAWVDTSMRVEGRTAITTLRWSQGYEQTLEQRLWDRRELLGLWADGGWKLEWQASDYEGRRWRNGDVSWVGRLVHVGDVEAARLAVPGLTAHADDWRRPLWRR